MSLRQLDAVLAYANKTHPGHVRYLTDYESRLGIHDSAVCLVTENDCVLLTNAGFDRAETQTWLGRAVVSGDYAAEVAAHLPRGMRTLGIAGFPAFPAPVYLGLAARFPEISIIDASQLLLELRQVKSRGEVALLRRCAKITDAGGQAFLEHCQPGVSERELAVKVESAIKLAGGEELSFSTQVGCGQRTEQVVVFPTDRLIPQDTLVQLDCGATFAGYRGDLSRVVFPGHPSGRIHELMNVTAEIYERCLERMRPGVACAEIAQLARNIADRYGLAEFLYRSPNHPGGFLGHSIGCSYCEPPEIHPENSSILEEQMVIVLEPILTDPAVGGVKIEDAVLITAGTPERLSQLPIRTWGRKN